MAEERILIVEDNAVNRKLFLTVLRPHGYHLFTAVDGEEALEIAARELPDLILMDLQLPKMNGFEVTRQLKEQSLTARIPVMAITAHAMAEERLLAEQGGFSAYVTKPINTRTFPQQVRELLDGIGK